MKLLTLFALSAATLLTSCATSLSQPISGYLCCNQSSSKGWISSENVQGGMPVPFGQPAKVDSLKRTRYAYGAIGDTSFGFSEDSSKSEGTTLEWLRQIIVKDDPTLVFNTWPVEVRAAISGNKVFAGMTRAQVVMALGYPSRSETPKLDAPVWKYWTAVDDDLVELRFDNDTLASVSGKPVAVRLIQIAR